MMLMLAVEADADFCVGVSTKELCSSPNPNIDWHSSRGNVVWQKHQQEIGARQIPENGTYDKNRTRHEQVMSHDESYCFIFQFNLKVLKAIFYILLEAWSYSHNLRVRFDSRADLKFALRISFNKTFCPNKKAPSAAQRRCYISDATPQRARHITLLNPKTTAFNHLETDNHHGRQPFSYETPATPASASAQCFLTVASRKQLPFDWISISFARSTETDTHSRLW
jgi:hypothetical protein